MTASVLSLLLLCAGSHAGPADTRAEPVVGCCDTHEWVDVGSYTVSAIRGRLEVRYQAGDTAALPEAMVVVAQVEPFIRAFVAETDDAGEFSIPGVPTGQWRMNVCMPGFKTLEGTVTVASAESADTLELVTELDW